MTTIEFNRAGQSPIESTVVVTSVTVIVGTVVGLTFMFGFGNVLSLALRLGVPGWVAPLVAPAVDLSILGLLLGIRHLALTGASADLLRPARRMLVFASAVTLALNVADPLFVGEYGKAAFDAVGPLLLIGWAEVGPGFLRAIGATSSMGTVKLPVVCEGAQQQAWRTEEVVGRGSVRSDPVRNRPISADTMRVRLGIGATSARQLVKIIRAEFQTNNTVDPASEKGAPKAENAAVSLVA
ncbi:hypothetical protein [Actinocrispum wychmicini]|uniref:DUF2637 domain-containing protein n=1 Tax=Actinocrispum wychmicini TaxID=1213861 RepID=A0A4R2JHQ6_9PSEU|nr:hypothetical protein [Actinocrispum wychmicini]TCO59403.1 hypothetical protein EV192_104244 [Actinocrispum wychmicini]